VIRYIWMAFVALILLYSPAFAQGQQQQEQDAEPEFAAAQMGKKTVMMLPANWTVYASEAEVTLTSSAPVEKALASEWWNATVEQPNRVTFTLAENVDRRSMFIVHTNSTEVSYSYRMTINSTSYSGRIVPEASGKESKFVKWNDSKEDAASAFIPEEWSADLQLIRPYKSMTGFVFFARGDENTLVYVFQPFMPLHVLPSESLCDTDNMCSGRQVSTEEIRELSFGNAPVVISDMKTPEQYFSSEVLPALRENLNAYGVKSSLPVHALAYGGNNLTRTAALMPALDMEYGFDVEGKRISGRAMVFTRNHTSAAGDAGFWNGFIVGVESAENNFDRAFQQAAVTLLTLRFDEKWLSDEEKVLLENADASPALGAVARLMANSTLDDFRLIVPTAAHKMVRSYNDTMIAGYIDTETDEELHLPLFPDLQRWYLDGDQLIGKKAGRNPKNSSSLEPLF
jgi:hypothetical protein